MTRSRRIVSTVRVRFRNLLVFVTIGCVTGCAPDEPFAPPESKSAGETRELWDVVYMQGDKVGYQQTRITPVAVDGAEVLKIEVDNQITIKRFGEITKTTISYTSLETKSGGVIWFTSSFGSGTAQIKSRGVKKDGKLEIETVTQGRTQVDSLDWDDSWGGYYSAQNSLNQKPMKAGETRKLRFLMEGQNALADIEMKAIRREETAMLAGKQKLLRVDAKIQIAGTKIEQTMWIDEAGEPLKSVIPAFNMTVYRSTKEIATREADEINFDIGEMSVVRVQRQLNDPHNRKRIVYRARLKSGKIKEVFPSGLSQSVKTLGNDELELTVVAIRPDQPRELKSEIARPTPDDSRPNSLIQSDDERITQMAEQAAGDEADPWTVAQKLERYVHEKIAEKNFSQAIATAADVARDLEGDCTEHSVLLAALCRARKIPARVAVGLIHFRDSKGSAFAYHMWNEVWIKDRWVPLDATIALGGIGAGHLKLADSNLKGASPFSVFAPVLNVIGQLELEVVKVE